VVVVLAAPLSVTVAPLPLAAGLMVPETASPEDSTLTWLALEPLDTPAQPTLMRQDARKVTIPSP